MGERERPNSSIKITFDLAGVHFDNIGIVDQNPTENLLFRVLGIVRGLRLFGQKKRNKGSGVRREKKARYQMPSFRPNMNKAGGIRGGPLCW